MKIDFFTVLINVLCLLLLGVPSYIFRKRKMLGEKSALPLVTILIYGTQPFLILMSFQGKSYTPELLESMGIVFGFAVVMHIVILFAARLIFSKINIEKAQKGALVFASAFSNCGYIGIPIITALYAGSSYLSEMLIYLTVYIVVFNMVNWTLGIYLISGNKKYISIKNALINPTTVALVVALPLFFLDISLYKIAEPLARTFSMIGDMTTPLSMLILGIKLAEIRILDVFNNIYVYLSTAIKLVAMPLVAFALLKVAGAIVTPQIFAVVFLVTAMPTASITVANAERFGGDSGIASKAMLCSTLLSILTLPLLSLLM